MPDKPLTIEQLLALLAEGPPRIAALTDALDPAQLQTLPAEGEWSPNEVLAHLRSCADMWGGAIQEILAHDHPTLKAVNPRTWIHETDYLDLEFRPSLDAFAKQRADLLALLEPLPPAQWQRAATVMVAGKPLERTVHFYAQWLATHERSHVKHIACMMKRLQA